ncbi:MAG: NlpC/P60 family protein [Brachybacterium paraconglomeratum]|nr:NlpC/P60 family protein [Brachybacterium paraconglomeratum]
MSDGHPRTVRLLATLAVAALASPLLMQSAGHAEPEIDEVQARVDRLYHEAEIASERYNDIRTDLERSRDGLGSLRRDLRRQRRSAEVIREEVAAAVVARYQGQSFSSAAQVVLADDPDAFLETLGTVAAYDAQQADLMRAYALEARRLELREEAMQRELAAIAEDEARLAEEKELIEAKAAEADELLATLEAEQRQAMAEEKVGPTPAPASGGAAAVVDYALAQVGKAYVWAAAGPSSYDCSGLTMMAWAQAGVSLPHSSSGQMSAGTPVAQSELMPGDLVFYYSPVSHVGIYIGNGQIVDAANPSTGVRVASVNSMPYSGAVRPG